MPPASSILFKGIQLRLVHQLVSDPEQFLIRSREYILCQNMAFRIGGRGKSRGRRLVANVKVLKEVRNLQQRLDVMEDGR